MSKIAPFLIAAMLCSCADKPFVLPFSISGCPSAAWPQNKEVYSIWFSGTKCLGYAVSQNGLVMRYDSLAEAWCPDAITSNKKPVTLFSVSMSDDGERGFAVGQQGRIVRFDSEKEGWFDETRPPEVSGNTLRGVWVSADGKDAWIVGENGTILHYDRYSTYWSSCRFPAEFGPRHLYALAFTSDGKQGWAAGENGTLLRYRSDDGTWQWYGKPGAVTRKTLTALWIEGGGTRGWAAGDGVLLKYDGRAWQEDRRSVDISGQQMLAIAITRDGSTGWMGGSCGTLRRFAQSTDSWVSFSDSCMLSLGTIRALWVDKNSSDAWGGGDRGMIAHWNNGRQRWQETSVMERKYAGDIKGIWIRGDGIEGWAVGQNGEMLRYHTPDSLWVRKKLPESIDGLIPLRDIWMTADGNDGCAVGEQGVILRFNGKNRKWETAVGPNSLTASTLFSVSGTEDGAACFAAGENGVILFYNGQYRSWQIEAKEDSLTDRMLTSVSFSPNGKCALVAGDGGIILRYNGPYIRWTLESQPGELTDKSLSDIWMNDSGTEAWVAGNEIFLHYKKGSGWDIAGEPRNGWIHSLQMNRDGTQGWAAGDNGAVYSYSRKSAKWELVCQPGDMTGANLYALAITDSVHHSWAGGTGGTLFRCVQDKNKFIGELSAPSEKDISRLRGTWRITFQRRPSNTPVIDLVNINGAVVVDRSAFSITTDPEGTGTLFHVTAVLVEKKRKAINKEQCRIRIAFRDEDSTSNFAATSMRGMITLKTDSWWQDILGWVTENKGKVITAILILLLLVFPQIQKKLLQHLPTLTMPMLWVYSFCPCLRWRRFRMSPDKNSMPDSTKPDYGAIKKMAQGISFFVTASEMLADRLKWVSKACALRRKIALEIKQSESKKTILDEILDEYKYIGFNADQIVCLLNPFVGANQFVFLVDCSKYNPAHVQEFMKVMGKKRMIMLFIAPNDLSKWEKVFPEHNRIDRQI